jgi:uncharacterized protein YecT (DUF1311 family)
MLRAVFGALTWCVLAGVAVAGPQVDPCKTRANQLELTQCADRQLAKSDAVLNQTYRKLLADLDDEHRALLQKAQRAWVGFRDADCDLDASVALGGSMYGMLVSDCRAARTDERVKELKALRTSLADFLR